MQCNYISLLTFFSIILAQAKQLTAKAEGKHHLAHFLPPEEQQKFWNTLTKKKKAGQEAGTSGKMEDYVENRLQEDNAGEYSFFY